ncbi:hypothetical protein F4820DRAFT_441217 [Hypoxylon rubiginosum]|uniref:Uncharacterized protein n=1 Tax=Hypoxylon rubiginosum TaxID=110542 RepID=A0ACB9YIL0_9PEZI|nr:hypothetical protein F4820DRAFT_441217 [Hypoxylon rubiginosum]
MRAMAELSRRDNELMIQVAKDSRTVAIATARDSAAMQVIAAVTVLFLPAAFTAVRSSEILRGDMLTDSHEDFFLHVIF